MKFFNIDDNKVLKISLIFLPFFLIFSRFLADFYISILSLFLINHYFFYKNINIKNILIKIFLLFYLYLIFNSFFSFDSLISFKKSIPYFRFIFFTIILILIFSKNEDSIDLLIKSFFVSHTLLFLDSTLQFFSGSNFFGNEPINGRVSSLFFEELILGSYISKTLPIILSLLIFNKNKYSVSYEYYIILISLIMTFYSAERVGFFSCIIMSIFYLFISSTFKKSLVYLTIFVLAFYTLSIFSQKTYDRLFTHTLKQIQTSTNYIWPSFRHELHALTSIKMFKDNFVIGNGLYSFRYLCSEEKYIPKEKIKDNNFFYAPESGIFEKYDEGYNLILDNAKPGYEGTRKQLTHKGYYFYENNELVNTKVKKGDILYSNYEYPNGCNTHPHNYHLQFLAEIGLVGYLFLFLFFIYISIELLKNLLKKFLNKDQYTNLTKGYICSLFGLFLFLIPLFPSGNFFNNWISIIFYTNLSVMILYQNKIYS